MKVVFLGPPGAGKGTQAKLLAEKKQLAHISTGEMLRAAVQEGSPLGLQVKDIMEGGKLVPDELMVGVIEDRIKKPDCKNGYILDGFPRTIAQAKALEEMLGKSGAKLDAVVTFDLDEKVVIARLEHRRGAESRADDEAEVQLKRMREYREKTEPLLGHYANSGLMRRVDASGSVEQVNAKLLESLKA